MGKKTLIKRVLKWLDLSPDLALAIEMDTRGDGYSTSTTDMDTEESIEEEMREQARKTQDELGESLDDARREEIVGSET